MDEVGVESPIEIWTQAFNIARREIDVPTVWLAMQAVRPLTIDANRFVVALPEDMRYLAVNLETPEYTIAIEEALAKAGGRPLALTLIEGQTLEDWIVERATLNAPPASVAKPAPKPTQEARSAPAPSAEAPRAHPDQPAAPGPAPYMQPVSFPAYGSWDRLNEALAQGQRAAPLMRYPYGQAGFLLKAVQMISAAIDEFMDQHISDPNQERQLAKSIERLAAGLTLDPLFVALELRRYRKLIGKE